MKNVILILVFITGFLFQGNAQKYEYDNITKGFIGLNIGHTWHTSDVKNIKERFPLGAGIIGGVTLNRDYGKQLTFDIRLRYLGGSWYGQDKEATTALENNIALESLYNTPGYAVQNFKSIQHSLDLELAVHFNRVKERTGLDPYIFGGIGIVGTRTKGALTSEYPSDVKGLKYDIPLDMNKDGEPYDRFGLDTKILPSLGIGIGYFFNSQFSLGLEHRSTFFRGDYFDGTTTTQAGIASKPFKNDIYHYTSIYFKFYFKKKDRTRNPPKDPEVDGPITNNPPPTRRPPLVDFTNPSRTPTSTQQNVYNITAHVQYVNSTNNVTFTQNGRKITDFTYNPTNGSFQSNVVLQNGNNTFTLTGVNQDGSASDQTVIIKEEEYRAPPIVNIVDPSTSPYTTNQTSYKVKADIQNIQARNQLSVTFNGANYTNYSFTPGGGINFNTNLSLQAGTNVLTIVGTNEFGSDSDETVIIYKRQPSNNGNPPVVTITNPGTSPHTANQANIFIVAQVNNVTSKQQIEVKVNGAQTSNFTFNSTANQVQFNANLNVGSNYVTVQATNDYGIDSDQAQIIYQRQPTDNGNPPYVNITTPSANPYTTNNATQNVVATVQNVSNKSQITVQVNGVTTNNFTYSAANKKVNLNVNLVEGTNLVNVTATNNVGTASDATQINYKKRALPPTVDITTPSASTSTVNVPTQIVIANVQHVTSKNQIEVRVNGAVTTNFTYSTATKLVQLTVNLTKGTNTVYVKATNNDGTASDQVQITYRKPITGTPPSVEIVKPTASPYTTGNAVENVLATVNNVTNKNQIEVKVNGTNVDFTYTLLLKRVQFDAQLSEGSNIVTITATNNFGTASDQTQITYKRKQVMPPTVNITTPNANPFDTDKSIENVVATVNNVESKNQIEVKINGATTNAFTYNSTSKKVEFMASLVLGTNTVNIKATNAGGTASDEVLIRYKKSNADDEGTGTGVGFKPIVKILTPVVNPYTTSNSTEHVVATATLVTTKQQIEVKVNGTSISNFTFNNTTRKIEFDAALNTGNNTVEVSATSAFGTGSAQTVIIYQKAAPKGPNVNFITPADGVGSTFDATYTLVAKVENVTQKNDVKVYLNNALISATKYSFNTQNQTVQFAANLKIGTNTVKVSGQNSYGTDDATATVTRKLDISTGGTIDLPCDNDPSIQFFTPASSNITVYSRGYQVVAGLGNIENKNQISVYLNGQKKTDFKFDSNTKSIRHNVILKGGVNTYKVVVKNKCSTKQEQVVINYTVPICGVPINLKSGAEFCLITPKGTIDAKQLAILSNSYSYKGAATGLYFKALEDGFAKVGNNDFILEKDNFYKFAGNITVELKKVNGQWNICVQAARMPIFGKGGSAPESLCNPKPSQDGKKPVIDLKPGEIKVPIINDTHEEEKGQAEPTRRPGNKPEREPTRRPGGRR